MHAKTCMDAYGNEFNSVKEMCKVYGINYAMYVTKAKKIKQYGVPKRLRRNRDIIMIKGKWYGSIKEACDDYNMPYNTVMYRLNRGWTLERALIQKVREKTIAVKCTDGTTEYSSLGEMARAHGVKEDTLYHRYNRGSKLIMDKVKDHLGNEYKTVKDMCFAYGITLPTYYSRKRNGMSLEERLTHIDDRFTCYDHLGFAYKNERAMCDVYGVNINTFRAKKRKGMSIKEILTGKETSE